MTEKPQTSDISASLSDNSQQHFSKLVQNMDEKEENGTFYMVYFLHLHLKSFTPNSWNNFNQI